MVLLIVVWILVELARDHLNHSGRYIVERGVISIVHDSYGKKVRVLLYPLSTPSHTRCTFVGAGTKQASQGYGRASPERLKLD